MYKEALRLFTTFINMGHKRASDAQFNSNQDEIIMSAEPKVITYLKGKKLK